MSVAVVCDLELVGAEIQRRTAELFHLKAGLAKVQVDVDQLIEKLAVLNSENRDQLEAAASQPTELQAVLPAILDEAEARRQLEEFDETIARLEDAARSALGTPLSGAGDADHATTVTEVASLDEESGHPIQHDDLTAIRGLTPAIADRLALLGYTSFQSIAEATAEDVARIKSEIEDATNLARDGWIEQAAILAMGIETHHVRQIRATMIETAAKPESHCDQIEEMKPTAEVIPLVQRQHSNMDIVAAARADAAGIGRKMIYAAAVAAMLFVMQTAQVDVRSLLSNSNFEQFAACGQAVLSGDATCAAITWSRT